MRRFRPTAPQHDCTTETQRHREENFFLGLIPPISANTVAVCKPQHFSAGKSEILKPELFCFSARGARFSTRSLSDAFLCVRSTLLSIAQISSRSPEEIE